MALTSRDINNSLRRKTHFGLGELEPSPQGAPSLRGQLPQAASAASSPSSGE